MSFLILLSSLNKHLAPLTFNSIHLSEYPNYAVHFAERLPRQSSDSNFRQLFFSCPLKVDLHINFGVEPPNSQVRLNSSSFRHKAVILILVNLIVTFLQNFCQITIVKICVKSPLKAHICISKLRHG